MSELVSNDPVLLVGATSGLARSIARGLAVEGRPLILAARDVEEATLIGADLRVRYGINIAVQAFDALEFDSHGRFFEACLEAASGNLGGMVVCHGDLADGIEAQEDFSVSRRLIDVNYTSFVSILNIAAEYFEHRRSGYLCVLSSVAGDRGRSSNYVYGSTKAAVSTYLQGLRARMTRSGVQVITVKPGFIDTAMTWGLKAPGPVGKAEIVGRDVCRAIAKRRNVVYTPWIYRWVMLIVRLIPEPIFKRLKL